MSISSFADVSGIVLEKQVQQDVSVVLTNIHDLSAVEIVIVKCSANCSDVSDVSDVSGAHNVSDVSGTSYQCSESAKEPAKEPLVVSSTPRSNPFSFLFFSCYCVNAVPPSEKPPSDQEKK